MMARQKNYYHCEIERQKNGSSSHSNNNINTTATTTGHETELREKISTNMKNRDILNEKQRNENLPLCHNCVVTFLVVRTFSSYALFETHLLFLLLNRSFRMDPYGNMRLSRRHFTKSQIRKKERENVAEEGVREKTDWDWIKNATNMLWNDGNKWKSKLLYAH